MIVAENLSFSVGGALLLDGIDLRLQPGTITAILGPNGAGKSTLLGLLAGERRPDGGAVRLDGRPLAQWGARALATRRAVVPQSSTLAFPFTVAQVVGLGLAANPPPAARRPSIVERAMAAADVAHLADRVVPSLSGGERQRTAFARALAQLACAAPGDACALLLDEPTASLDPGHQHGLLAAVRGWVAESGGCAAVVLHDLTLAAQYADRVLVLRGGRVAVQGGVEALTPEALQPVYGIAFDRLRGSGGDPVLVARRPA